MINTSFRISRRSFLIGLFSIYISKNSSRILETITLSDKEILPEAANTAFYKWILDKNDLE